MGYTHYFNFNNGINEFSEKVLNEITTVTEKYQDILVVDELSKMLINLNGIEEDSYETFYISTDLTSFNFCKTARRPYDLPVCEILLILKYHYGDNFNLKSDGFAVSRGKFEAKEIEDTWMEALENIKGNFGYEFELVGKISESNGRKYYSFDIVQIS